MISQLHEVAAMGDRKALRHLLKMGLSTEDQDEHGCTPMMLAAEDGHWQIVQELLSHGARTEAANQYGYTALMLASVKGNTDVIHLLVENGAALEARNVVGATALNFASLVSGKIEGIETLIDLGADIETADNSGYTPLLSACEGGHLEAVRLLLRLGARADATTKQGGTVLSVNPLRTTQVRDMGLSMRLEKIAVLLREMGVKE